MSKRWPSHRLSLALAFVLGGTLTASCRKSPPPAPTESSARPAPSPSVSAVTPSPGALPAANASDASPTPAPPAPCRALRVTGSARTETGQVLASQGDLDGQHWLELGKQSEVVVRHGVSARELSLFGPGKVWPCRFGQEQVLLAEGKFESSSGTGVRPGAEVWVATPFGAVRYADADLQIISQRDGLQLTVRGGQAFVESMTGLRGAQADGRVAGPNGRATLRGRPDAPSSVQACEAAAQAASDSARQLVGAKAEELGRLAAVQLRARRLARGRCLAAEASVAWLTDPGARARLGDQVQRAAALWQGIPSLAGEAREPGR